MFVYLMTSHCGQRSLSLFIRLVCSIHHRKYISHEWSITSDARSGSQWNNNETIASTLFMSSLSLSLTTHRCINNIYCACGWCNILTLSPWLSFPPASVIVISSWCHRATQNNVWEEVKWPVPLVTSLTLPSFIWKATDQPSLITYSQTRKLFFHPINLSLPFILFLCLCDMNVKHTQVKFYKTNTCHTDDSEC